MSSVFFQSQFTVLKIRESASENWCLLVRCEESSLINEIEEELDRICSEDFQQQCLKDVVKGTCCIAWNLELRRFVRAYVENVFDDKCGIMRCFAVDYGNSFDTSFKMCRRLPLFLSSNAKPFMTRYLYIAGLKFPERAGKFDAAFFEELRNIIFTNNNGKVNASVRGFDKSSNLCGDILLSSLNCYLSEVLIERGLCEPKPESEWHLFPQREFSPIAVLKLRGKCSMKEYFNAFLSSLSDPDSDCETFRIDSSWNLSEIPNIHNAAILRGESLSSPKIDVSASGHTSPKLPGENSSKPLSRLARIKQLGKGMKSSSLSGNSSGSDAKDEGLASALSDEPSSSMDESGHSRAAQSRLSPVVTPAKESFFTGLSFLPEVSDLSFGNTEQRHADNFLDYKFSYLNSVFVVGIMPSTVWSTAESIKKNFRRPKLALESNPSDLEAIGYPAVMRYSCDFVGIVGIERNSELRRRFYCQVSIWNFAERQFEIANDTKISAKGIEVNGPYVLFIVPNANAVMKVKASLTKYEDICYSNKPRVKLDYGVDDLTHSQFAITTPKVLLKSLQSGRINFPRLKIMVIDYMDEIINCCYPDLVSCFRLLKRCQSQMIFNDWRLYIFSSSYHYRIEKVLKIRNLKSPDFKKFFTMTMTDLIQATAFLGVLHCPFVCENASSKSKTLKSLLAKNNSENALVVTASENTALMLSSSLKQEGYFVLLQLGEIQLVGEQSDRQVVVTTDEYMKEIDDDSLFNLVISYDLIYDDPEVEVPNNKETIQRTLEALGSRAWMLKNYLREEKKKVTDAKVFYLVTPNDDSYQLLGLQKCLNQITSSIPGDNLKLFDQFMKRVHTYVQSSKNSYVPICDNMLLKPTEFDACHDALCTKRHRILPEDKPGSQSRYLKLPHKGFCRIRVREIIDTNSFYATLDEIRETQTEPYKIFSKGKSKDIDLLLEKLSPLMPAKPKVDNLYIYKSEQGVLKRAVVTKVTKSFSGGESMQVTIFRVDVGDTVTGVNVKQLFQVPANEPELKQAGLAIKVFIPGIQPFDSDHRFTPESRKCIKSQIHGKVLEGVILLAIGNMIFVDMLTERRMMANGEYTPGGFKVVKHLIEQNHCIENDNQIEILYEKARKVFEELPTIRGKVNRLVKPKVLKPDTLSSQLEEVFINPSAFKSPDNFIVIKAVTLKKVAEIDRSIRKGEKLAKSSQLSEGQMCVATFKRKVLTFELEFFGSTDWKDRWYRVRIVKCNLVEKQAEVYLVDFGEKVKLKISRLRQPKPSWLQTPFAAMSCSMPSIIRPPEPTIGYKEKAKEYFEETSDTRKFVLMGKSAIEESKAGADPGLQVIDLKYTPLEEVDAGLGEVPRYDFAIDMVYEGLAVTDAESMPPVFQSMLADLLISIHCDARMSLEEKVKQIAAVQIDRLSAQDAQPICFDLIYLYSCYTSLSMLETIVGMFVDVSQKVAVPQEVILDLCLQSFGSCNLNENIVSSACYLIKQSLEDSDQFEFQRAIFSCLVKQFSLLQNDPSWMSHFCEVLARLHVSVILAEDDEWIGCLANLVEKYETEHLLLLLNTLHKHLMDKVKAEDYDFVDSLGKSGIIAVLSRKFSETENLKSKACILKLLDLFFTRHSFKFQIGHSRLFQQLPEEIKSGSNKFYTMNATKLYKELQRYRESEEAAHATKQPEKRDDVIKELNLLKRAKLSKQKKYLPTVFWSMSGNIINIRFDVLGVKEKYVKCCEKELLFQALTGDGGSGGGRGQKFYECILDLSGRIDPYNVVQTFTGRQCSLKVVSTSGDVWQSLTITRHHNVKYDVFQIDETFNLDQTKTEKSSVEEGEIPWAMIRTGHSTSGEAGAVAGADQIVHGRPDSDHEGGYNSDSDDQSDFSNSEDMELMSDYSDGGFDLD